MLRQQLLRQAWLLALLLWTTASPADDRQPLDHSDYDRWHTLGPRSLSHDGKWIAYSVVDGKGQATLKIRRMHSDQEYAVPRGSAAEFSFDSRFLAYRVSPDPELLKRLRKEKKKPEELPGDQLCVLELESGRQAVIEEAKSFAMPPDHAGWLAILLDDAGDVKLDAAESKVKETLEVTSAGLQRPLPAELSPARRKQQQPATSQPAAGKAAEPPAKSAEPTDRGTTEKKEKKSGSTLVLRRLDSEQERRFPNVTEFAFSKYGDLLVFATSAAESPDGDGVWVLDLKRDALQQIVSGLGNYQSLAVDEKGRQVAFLTDRDDYAAKQPSWSLYYWRQGQKSPKPVAAGGLKGIPEGWRVSPSAPPRFSEDARRLYFSTAPQPEPPAEEDPDAEPQAVLDLWHWQDPQLQPQQLLEAEREKNRSYRAVFDVKSQRATQLATPDVPDVDADWRSPAEIVVGSSDVAYRKLMSWDLPGFRDIYLIRLRDGKAEKVIERSRSEGSLSPNGKHLVWWDTDSRAWWSMPVQAPAQGERPRVPLTRGIAASFADELHDTPSDPRPYGIAGWTPKDERVLLYDRYDIWLCDPTGEAPPHRLTNDGREKRLRFRHQSLDREARFIDLTKPQVLSVFNEASKASGYYLLEPASQATGAPGQQPATLQPLLVLDESVEDLIKARHSDDVVLVRSTFERSPDLWRSTLEMKQLDRISRINPQQNEYLWGSAELVHWNSAQGAPLEGLLYKPEDFDPGKKYPLLVYFYERNSDNLHRYYAPAAGRSIINFSFYVSRGYVIFVPDIPYQTGYPGQSAADSVLPGVEHLLSLGYIDRERIGMQGHSWGGYQAAYLVTQTNLFACAEAGAPVSNMTSAYGGIRWSSGMSRMFQYERTQSRIGRTLWEARDLYIQNSPLFLADKIQTPLLILHNDEDGAVPWYQGIELFVALRRLERPAWLLNYNGQPHWVMKEENRRDFARRMQQFFDHYLKGDPMPRWMAEGLPAIDKGREFGFEYVLPEAASDPSQSAAPPPTTTR